MTINLKMWGNSLGIRLPSVVARSMHLEDGMVADLMIENGQIRISPHAIKAPRQRRPFSFYENRAKKLGLANLVEAVEITPDDAPRGLEIM
jgi:antitoxin component of MazEF toxin-antitoxin module